jgi:hypothetical protein
MIYFVQRAFVYSIGTWVALLAFCVHMDLGAAAGVGRMRSLIMLNMHLTTTYHQPSPIQQQ